MIKQALYLSLRSPTGTDVADESRVISAILQVKFVLLCVLNHVKETHIIGDKYRIIGIVASQSHVTITFYIGI